jgi:hypothetical protein
MCAPRNDLAKLAIIGAAAYATGGISLGSTAATTAREAAIIANSGVTTTSTLSGLLNAARVALPVISTAGNIYQGYMKSSILAQQANFLDFEVEMERESSALREAKRNRALAIAIGQQNAKFGLTGVTLEGSPGDVLAQTRSAFAEDQYIDDFNTSQSIYSKQTQSAITKKESEYAKVGGYINAASSLGTRGFKDLGTKDIENVLTTTRKVSRNILDTVTGAKT